MHLYILLTNIYFYIINLKVARTIIISNVNPVVMEETISRPATNPTTNRPVPRVMRVVYSYNDLVQRLEDWSHPSLEYTQMVDDTVSFNASLFVTSPLVRTPSTTAASSERGSEMSDD